MSEHVCPFMTNQLGKDGRIHEICNIGVFDGEFGSHESTCNVSGDLQRCRFNLTDW